MHLYNKNVFPLCNFHPQLHNENTISLYKFSWSNFGIWIKYTHVGSVINKSSSVYSNILFILLFIGLVFWFLGSMSWFLSLMRTIIVTTNFANDTRNQCELFLLPTHQTFTPLRLLFTKIPRHPIPVLQHHCTTPLWPDPKSLRHLSLQLPLCCVAPPAQIQNCHTSVMSC